MGRIRGSNFPVGNIGSGEFTLTEYPSDFSAYLKGLVKGMHKWESFCLNRKNDFPEANRGSGERERGGLFMADTRSKENFN